LSVNERPAAQGPRDAVEVQLCDIWQAILNRPFVGVDDDFFDLGGDSLLAIRVIAEVDRLFGARLSPADFLTSPRVADVGSLIRTAGPMRAEMPLVRIQAGGKARSPLYLFHALSGTVLPYVSLARALGSERTIWGLQSPGLNSGEAPLASIEAMAATYLRHMREVHPGGTWHLAGYSFGGLIAFEAARRLSADAQEVGFVGLIDTAASTPQPPSEQQMLTNHLRNLARRVLHLDIDLEWLYRLPRDQQISVLLKRGVAEGRLPADYDADRVHQLLKIRLHNRIVEAEYQPKPYAGKVVLFSSAATAADRHLGWDAYVDTIIEHKISDDEYSTGSLDAHLAVLESDTVVEVSRVMHRYMRSADIE